MRFFAPHCAKGCGNAHTTQRNSKFWCHDRKIASVELKMAHNSCPNAGVRSNNGMHRGMGRQIESRSPTTQNTHPVHSTKQLPHTASHGRLSGGTSTAQLVAADAGRHCGDGAIRVCTVATGKLTSDLNVEVRTSFQKLRCASGHFRRGRKPRTRAPCMQCGSVDQVGKGALKVKWW